MLIRWRTLGLALLPTLLINAQFSFEDIDFDNLSDSDEYVTPKRCQKGNIFCLMHQNAVSSPQRNVASTPVDLEDIGEKKHEESKGIFSVLTLLKSFFPQDGQSDKTKIIFNIRDIQSGFYNSGKKYHIGNLHRELLRAKREAENDENEDNTANENIEVKNDSLIQNYTDINVEDVSESVFEKANVTVEDSTDSKTTPDYSYSIENTTTINIDNFKNQTLSEQVLSSLNTSDSNQIIVDAESSNAEVRDLNSKIPISNITTEYPSDASSDINNRSTLPESNQNFNYFSALPPNTRNGIKSSKSLQSQYFVPKPNVQGNNLSEDQLKKLQIVIDKELGIDTVNYTPVTNFSFTIDGSNSKSNQPIVVIVYKCNCEHNDTETNKNNVAQSNNDVSHNVIEKNNNHSYEYFYKYWRMVPHNSKLTNFENKTANTHLNSSITMEKLLQCQTLLASLTNNISGNTENVERYRDSSSPLELRNGNRMTETHSRIDTNEYNKTPNSYAKSVNEGVKTNNYINMLADGLKVISSAPILNNIPVQKEIGDYDNWRRSQQSNILKSLGIDLIKKREVDNTTMTKYMDNEPIKSDERNINVPNDYFKYDLDDTNSINNLSNENNITIIEINSFNTDNIQNESESDSHYEIVTNAFKYDDDTTSITSFNDITAGIISINETIETSTNHIYNENFDDSSSDSDEYSNYDDDVNEDQNLKIKITVLWNNHRLKK